MAWRAAARHPSALGPPSVAKQGRTTQRRVWIEVASRAARSDRGPPSHWASARKQALKCSMSFSASDSGTTPYSCEPRHRVSHEKAASCRCFVCRVHPSRPGPGSTGGGNCFFGRCLCSSVPDRREPRTSFFGISSVRSQISNATVTPIPTNQRRNAFVPPNTSSKSANWERWDLSCVIASVLL